MVLTGSYLSRARPVRSDSFTALREAFGEAGVRSVLDLGCGAGELDGRLVEAGFEVTGVDPQAEAIERARAAVPAARFFCASAETLPEGIGPFDAACFVNALHHVRPAQMAAALTRALAAVRPGGHVIVIEPLAAGSFFRCLKPVDDETEVRARAIAAIEALLKSGEAKLVELERWDRESRFDGLEGFVDYLLAADPGRRALVRDHAAELARSWRDNIDVVEGRAVLIQPIICWTLVRGDGEAR